MTMPKNNLLLPELIKEFKHLSKLFELHSGQPVPPRVLEMLKLIREGERK